MRYATCELVKLAVNYDQNGHIPSSTDSKNICTPLIEFILIINFMDKTFNGLKTCLEINTIELIKKNRKVSYTTFSILHIKEKNIFFMFAQG